MHGKADIEKPVLIGSSEEGSDWEMGSRSHTLGWGAAVTSWSAVRDAALGSFRGVKDADCGDETRPGEWLSAAYIVWE